METNLIEKKKFLAHLLKSSYDLRTLTRPTRTYSVALGYNNLAIYALPYFNYYTINII